MKSVSSLPFTNRSTSSSRFSVRATSAWRFTRYWPSTSTSAARSRPSTRPTACRGIGNSTTTTYRFPFRAFVTV
jgi:hypothetical protein